MVMLLQTGCNTRYPNPNKPEPVQLKPDKPERIFRYQIKEPDIYMGNSGLNSWYLNSPKNPNLV
jgi:hypothetical protein